MEKISENKELKDELILKTHTESEQEKGKKIGKFNC